MTRRRAQCARDLALQRGAIERCSAPREALIESPHEGTGGQGGQDDGVRSILRATKRAIGVSGARAVQVLHPASLRGAHPPPITDFLTALHSRIRERTALREVDFPVPKTPFFTEQTAALPQRALQGDSPPRHKALLRFAAWAVVRYHRRRRQKNPRGFGRRRAGALGARLELEAADGNGYCECQGSRPRWCSRPRRRRRRLPMAAWVHRRTVSPGTRITLRMCARRAQYLSTSASADRVPRRLRPQREIRRSGGGARPPRARFCAAGWGGLDPIAGFCAGAGCVFFRAGPPPRVRCGRGKPRLPNATRGGHMVGTGRGCSRRRYRRVAHERRE